MTLLAAFQLLLARYTRQRILQLARPLPAARGPRSDRLIGFFVNTLVLRTW